MCANIPRPQQSRKRAISFGVGSQQTLSPNDAEAIARDCASAAATAIVVRARAQIVYMDLNWAPATVQGCDEAVHTVDEQLARGEPDFPSLVGLDLVHLVGERRIVPERSQ